MRKKSSRLVVLVTLLICFVIVGHLKSQNTQSASLTTASVTLSNPRLSFRGALEAGNTAGTSVVTIKTSGTAQPSLSSAQLLEGDTVRIGEGASLGSYTVASTNPDSEFTITSTLSSGDADEDDDAIASQAATLTVRFSTANAIVNGRFRILVPALSNDTNAADGIPDSGYFDFGNSAPTVTCPSDITGYDFVTGTATASTITVNSVDYHSYECAYSGAGAVGTDFDGTTNDAITIASVINPAPASGHSTGTADTNTIIIQQLDSSFSTQDSITVAVGVIEAVKVTATVAPTINFSIAGVSSSTSTCGITTDVTSTAATVPLGTLGLSAFTDAAQTLTVSTNAVNGYSVTAIENDQLGLNGAACTGDNTGNSCIRDSAGDNAAMTHAASDEWNTTSNKGFGYSIDNNDASAVPFQYSTSSGNCSGTYCARQFADAENSQTAVEIMSSSTVADTEDINVCYRIIPATTNSAGDYENNITYTATATF